MPLPRLASASPWKYITQQGCMEQTLGRFVAQDTAGEERGCCGALNGDVIRVHYDQQ
jgi:hypothetical protein